MAITKVEYLVDGVKIGERTSEPFNQFDYTFSGLGSTHNLTANLWVDGQLVKTTEPLKVGVVEKPALDPDYLNVLNYATANSIPLPTAEQQVIDNQLLIDYKATGAWDRDDVFLSFRGTADPTFKRICWKRLIQIPQYGGLTWDNFGAVGNSVNAYLDTQWIPSSQMVNVSTTSTSVLWDQKDLNNGSQSYATVFGCTSSASPYKYFLVRPSSGTPYMILNGGTAGSIAPSTFNKAGFNYATKLNNSAKVNGQSYSPTDHGAPNTSVKILNYNNTATGMYSAGWWGGTVGYLIIGADKSDILTEVETALTL